jgi:hypothetical protein
MESRALVVLNNNNTTEEHGGDADEYELMWMEPLLESGFQSWPLSVDRTNAVGFEPSSGERIRVYLRRRLSMWRHKKKLASQKATLVPLDTS